MFHAVGGIVSAGKMTEHLGQVAMAQRQLMHGLQEYLGCSLASFLKVWLVQGIRQNIFDQRPITSHATI